MPTEFTLPELGENVAAGDVVRILVSAGDTIAKDQPVLELETDKATIEVPSNVAGVVGEIRVKQGDKVKVGQVVLTLENGAGKGGGTAKPEAAAKAVPAAEAPAKGGKKAQGKSVPAETTPPAEAAEKKAVEPSLTAAPELAGGGDSAEPEAEESEEGGGAAADRGAAEREQGKADGPAVQAAETPVAPRKRGEIVDINRGARAQAPAAEAPATEPAAPAAPSVRRMARELGVDIRLVRGSGADGRISSEDVQAYVKAALAAGPGSAAPATGTPLPDFSKWGEVERKPMSNIRRKTAEHLSHSWTTVPLVTQFDKADISGIEALRKQFGPRAEKAGGKLTVTSIALKIVAAALKTFPQFNASVDPGRNEIIYKKSVHVGVAVDTGRGLLVPVIRDVDQKGIAQLSAELAKASERARTGKLSLDDMQGGGFTITNLGGIGGTAFTPIVNWPEVAILGMSRGTQEPFYTGAAFEPRLMLPLSLSYDHRVIDGADGARFLRWVAEAFEQPFAVLL